ncbi:MAG: PD-(D/E)XK nuclease family protein [bacterium]|nr:PD-(D/E)XK nuclease family protein [bacterium]
MQPQRVFINWDNPFLPQVASWLFVNYTREDEFDLSGLKLVLSTSRAGRRLLEILTKIASEKGLRLLPPRIISVGELPEIILEGRHQFPAANQLERRMAWIAALDFEDCAGIWGGGEGGKIDAAALPRYAAMAERLYAEVSGAGLRFSDVAELIRENCDRAEDVRWEVLSVLSERMRQELEQIGRSDIHHERITFLEREVSVTEAEVRPPQEIFLLATIDMPEITRRLLRRSLETAAVNLRSFVFAPQSCASVFDDLGCLVSESWIDRAVPLSRERIIAVQDPASEAAVAVKLIADWARNCRADECAIAICDDEVEFYLAEMLTEREVAFRIARGKPLAGVEIHKFFSCLLRFAEQRLYQDFSRLVRSPFVAALLEAEEGGSVARGQLISETDKFSERLLPMLLHGIPSDFPFVRRLVRRVDDLCQGLSSSRPLSLWEADVRSFLCRALGESQVETSSVLGRQTIAYLEALENSLSAIFHFGQSLPDREVPVAANCTENIAFNGFQVLGLLLGEASMAILPPEADIEAIEILGWLELLLDDNPRLVVTGVNEGKVPESLSSDEFFPDSIRRLAGMTDNDSRLARDVYIATALSFSRDVYFIAAKQSIAGDPLLPGRIIVRGETDQETSERVRMFSADSSLRVPWQIEPCPDESLVRAQSSYHWQPCKPEVEQGPAVVSVTAFRDYLDCPYKFYLRHVLRLEESREGAKELDLAAFGTLAHEVLAILPQLSAKDTANTQWLSVCLVSYLRELVEKRFGRHVEPGVYLQVEQLVRRLHWFANWQVEWQQDGWVIEQVEHEFRNAGCILDTDAGALQVRGRIDRIDRNLRSGERLIIDYKIGDKAVSPLDAVRRKKSESGSSLQWKDLQLPLYWHYARTTGFDAGLGLLSIPGAEEGIKLVRAEWSEDELLEALELARTVGAKILRGEFWPPSPTTVLYGRMSFFYGKGIVEEASVTEVDKEGEASVNA